MSFRVDISVRGGEEVRRKLEQMPDELHDALDEAVHDTADEILARSQEMVPVDKGTLKKSGNVRYGDLEATVGYNTPYARFVHEGTAPHDIYPRYASALAFPPFGARGAIRGGRRVGVYEFGGKTATVGLVFAKHVHHPGTRPQPFLRDAIEAVRPLVPQFFKDAIRKLLGPD